MVEAEIGGTGCYVEFRGVPPEVGVPKIRVRDIMAAVCAHRGLTLDELTYPGKRQYIARSRQMVMWLADKIRPDQSLGAVARALKRTDHTTTLWGVRKIDALIASGCQDTIRGLVEVVARLGIEKVDMTGEPRCRLTEIARAERDARREAEKAKRWNTQQSMTG